MEFLSSPDERKPMSDCLLNNSYPDSASVLGCLGNNTKPQSGVAQNTAENWLQLYHRKLSDRATPAMASTVISMAAASNPREVCHVPTSISSNLNAEATSVTTMALSHESLKPANVTISSSSATATATSACLSVNAAAAKVGKKRSRASRRAPTTLLNTDTTNFRAMVQQFTGITSAHFGSMPFSSAQLNTSPGHFMSRAFPHKVLAQSLSPSVGTPNLNSALYNNYRSYSQHSSLPTFPFQSVYDNNDAFLLPNFFNNKTLNALSQGGQQAIAAMSAGLLDEAALNTSSSSSSFNSPHMLSSDRKLADQLM